jgi:flavorubredoxin
MNAIILFDTKYGNTETIAKAIGNGMKEVGFDDIVVQNGGKTTHNELLEKDIWIFGSPTHRKRTSSNFRKLLKWVEHDTVPDTLGLAFETRMEDQEGGAARMIHGSMAGSGIEMLLEPESFIVEDKKGPLCSGEEERAVSLGRKIAGMVRDRS